MKTYRGTRIAGRARVEVLHDGGGYMLEHFVRHSPTGFEWGYGGSGPSELARCILIDHLVMQSLAARESVVPRVDRIYQDFKAEVIAALPRDRDWTLSESAVRSWVAEHEAKRAETH